MRLVRNDEFGLRVVKVDVYSLVRISWINWHVSSPRLPNTQNGNNHEFALVEEKSNELFRLNSNSTRGG